MYLGRIRFLSPHRVLPMERQEKERADEMKGKRNLTVENMNKRWDKKLKLNWYQASMNHCTVQKQTIL